MATLINDGWLYVSDGSDDMKVFFQQASWKFVRTPKHRRYEGGTTLRYDLQKKWLEIKVKNIYFTNYSDYETFVDKMNDWQEAGDITVGIYRNGTNFIEMKGNGNGTTFDMMMVEGIGDTEKLARGDQQVYVIKNLRLEE